MANEANGSAPGELKLEPHLIPTLRRAVRSALDQLTSLAEGGQHGPRMTRPAMADAASIQFQAAFNRFASEGPDSAAEALTRYRRRLEGLLTRLADIQSAYDRGEHETAAELSRQLRL